MSKLNQTCPDSGLLELVAKHSQLLSTVAGLLDSVFVRLKKLEQPHTGEVGELHTGEANAEEVQAAIADSRDDDLPPLEVRYRALAALVKKAAPMIEQAVEQLCPLAEATNELLASGQLQAVAEYMRLYALLIEDADRNEARNNTH